jgi:hypothetical protein
MIWLLLLGAAAAGWAWKTGRLATIRSGDVVAGLTALLALRMLTTGRILPGLIALAGSAYYAYQRQRRVTAEAMPADEARRVLELGPGADATAIRAAHRRLIARVHPDAGGSAELAHRVNAARDSLLAELRRRT